ncbi:MAG: alpha/beta hydrolase [Verrucomicrobia bacterium]|nr:alpha/beta hydrolase [Verrucomicrobiota bacterium]
MNKIKCLIAALLGSSCLAAAPQTYELKTSQGIVSVWDSRPGTEPAVLFIHGHNCNRTFFSKQIESPLLQKYRLVSLDLPGYGKSSPPKDPEKVYSWPGFADSVAEVAHLLKLEKVVVVGWSLGGHVALELTSRMPQIEGLLITGTPPIEVSAEGLGRGFRVANPKILELFGKGNLTVEEAQLMATISGYDYTPENRFMVDAILNTDYGAQTLYPRSIIDGVGQNQKLIAEQWPKPIAVIAGGADAGINNDYIIHEVNFKNLWRGKVHVIEGAGHAVQMDNPNEFNALVTEFINDIFN